MEGEIKSPVIKPISKAVAHRISSGQVILDLQSAVKELVENSLDAGASNIEISLKEYGQEYFKVIDNGCGISPDNFQALARKHHTSKLAEFSDLHALTTFGFRGEALSSLCALGNVTVETRTKNEPVGTHLTFDQSGLVTEERKSARQVGTTVTIEKLFSSLPVRSKEFSRNIRREYGKLVSLLNAYALIAKGVRFLCTNTTGRNIKSVVLKTQAGNSLKDNIITVFDLNTFQCLKPLKITISESCTVEGFLSRGGYGSGRNLGDRQYFYVNGRPVDMPKVSKLVNELYRSSNSKQYPIAIMNFIVPTTSYDVNVTPDKRKIFFSDEGSLVLSLREAIEKIYSPNQCSFSINGIKESNQGADAIESDAYEEDGNPCSTAKPSSPEACEQSETSHAKELIPEDNSPKILQGCSQNIYKGNGVVRCDENSPLKDLTGQVHEDTKCESLSAYQFKYSETSFKRNVGIDGKTPPLARSAMKDNFSQSNLVQSSLKNFVSVNKRKHENDCNVLTEVPLLRNQVPSCQVRKTSAVMHPSVSRSKAYKVPGDDLTGTTIEKLSKHDDTSNAPRRVEIPLSSECEISNGDFNGEDPGVQVAPSSVANVTLKRASGKDQEIIAGESSSLPALLEPCDVITDALKPCSGFITCSFFQFNMNDLRKRRLKRFLTLTSNITTYNGHCGKKMRRRYTAATLDNSQPESDEGKARSLAAAANELERFFTKEDFGRMQVVGQFNLGFIIGKLDQDLFIVDQHAADEKSNFEQLSQSTVLHLQPLLQPIRLELSPEEEVVASMHMGILKKNGFSLIEDTHAPPGCHFLLKAVPFSKNITFGVEDLKDLISTLADSQGECSIISSYKADSSDSLCPSRVRAMLASRACRTSVMIGDPLTHSEMQNILHNLAYLKSPWNCPHGRPTMRHLVDLSSLRDERSRTE